jgi:hypothetical protein
MFLSTEQTRAVMHGIDNKLSWQEIDRPAGPQPVPDWCKGVHVNWMEGYTNSPHVTLKVTENVRDWPNKRFRKEGSYYRAYHPDGRVEQYAHSGAARLMTIKMFRSADGSIRENRRCGPEWGAEEGLGFIYPDGQRHGMEPGEFVDVERLATTAQEGFGGAHIHLVMEDGTDLVLRGPWHVGAPEGFAELAFVDVGKRDAYSAWYERKGLPWHRRTATGGLYLRHDTFTAIMCRFAAHLPLASVTYGGVTTLEPFKPEWNEPKRLVYEREWLARKAAREAAKSEAA